MGSVYNSQLDAFDLYHKIQEIPNESSSILGRSTLPALGHAIAGSTGAAISNITTYPLALIVARLQIQKQLERGEKGRHSEDYTSIYDAAQKIYTNGGGLRELFAGLESDTAKTIADAFLFFLGYNYLRQSKLRSSSPSKHLSVIDELGVGFFAGSFSKFLTTPVANIVTRKQTTLMVSASHDGQNYSVAKQIYREKGLLGFWSGYSASLILTFNPSLTFFFFEMFKRIALSRERRSNPTARATFLLAALSKAMASAITYPFSLAKTRLQVSGNSRDEKGSNAEIKVKRGPINIFTIVTQIAKTEGLGGLYEGLRGEILKGFFSHGITMLTKEYVHNIVIQLYYAILKLLRRYPTANKLAGMAK